MTAPAATAPLTVAPKASDAGTEYVVLRQDDDKWAFVKKSTARTPDAAVKDAHGTGSAAVYVAVPARSWKPMKVTPKVETTLVVEAAKS